MIIVAIGSPALTVTLKPTIERPRPITNGAIIFAVPIGSHARVGGLIASRGIRIGVRDTGVSIVIGVGATRVYIKDRLASDVATGWLLGLAQDRRSTRFSRVDSRLQTLGARGSLFRVVFLTAITAFLTGAKFGS